ncbi:arginyl-tRNA synthetase [Halteromyces radiatus]|uniref:arginyl-tRNA synthetase n=1 Tax=Halteromyces radiatus TaxID=101107 RepID=UPI00221E4FEF|nr:arginyl-tRNA synthetase [Halteromyces radiatus]KAI8093105.1 arginyl-tRNA synthetase [Halteromyces radiatus]
MNSGQLFRQAIAKQLAQKTSCSETLALRLLGTPKATKRQQFGIPIPKLLPQAKNPTQICQDIAQRFEPDSWIEKATAKGPFLQFDLSLPKYIRHTLNQVYQQGDTYGIQLSPKNPKTILVDYSSPNIAKPFHAGHLRSTILGNFIKRSHEAMGHRVIGINYLGDWGKQYGLLAVGYEKYGDEKELLKDPIQHLYNVYVAINKDAMENMDVDQKANDYFKRMEQGSQRELSQWQRFRDISIEFYRTIYQRLNIEFDQYSGESQTEGYINQVYDLLEKKKLLTETDDGGICVDLEHYSLGKPIIRRSDGTTLYMTRDLASLLMRSELYSFDKAIYVVGTEQSLYLQQLFKIWDLMKNGVDQQQELCHANFGRIQGMSTRKGTVVFLQDILDTAKEKMMENMQQSDNKYIELMTDGIQMEDKSSTMVLKGQAAVDYVADRLGTSAVIIQDMVAKRIKNYTFSWDRMTAARGYTGVYLQFTYARLCGIERKSQVAIKSDCDTSLLLESDCAIDLVLTISQYPDIVHQSCLSMEPSTLVQYLFKLCHSISQSTANLRVKDVNDMKLAEARMLLFWSAKVTLANGLRILGMNPLERI